MVATDYMKSVYDFWLEWNLPHWLEHHNVIIPDEVIPLPIDLFVFYLLLVIQSALVLAIGQAPHNRSSVAHLVLYQFWSIL